MTNSFPSPTFLSNYMLPINNMNAPNCSICLEVVTNDNSRSIAKLKCGHFFHLDCIGSEFNIGGLMCCPNCRDIENGNWLFLQDEQPSAQYEEGEIILLPEPIVEVHFGPAVEVEDHIAGNIWPIVAANGGPMLILQQLQPIQNSAVNETVEYEPNLELSLASRNGPAPRPNEQAAGINLELSLATRNGPAPRPNDLAAGTNLGLSLALRNGPAPRPNEQAAGINLERSLATRNEPAPRPNDLAAGTNLELSLATRNGPAPRPNDLAAGTDLELSLARNSTYGEHSSSSQIWLENMNVDDPIEETMLDSNEEDDDEIDHPNMIQFL